MAVDKRFSSIHSRLLFTSLLPLILLCMVLAGYMISSQRVVLLTNLKNIMHGKGFWIFQLILEQ